MSDTLYTIPEHTRRQLEDAFTAKIQQLDAKFAGTTNVASDWTAKQYVKRLRDTIQWRVNNTRFGVHNAREFKAGFRSGFWSNLEAEPIKFDRLDQALLDSIPLPTGPVIDEMSNGLNRLRDDLFIAAATADSLGGAEPHITPMAFPVDQVVPVNFYKPLAALGANKGLTVWKVLEARRRFQKLYVDMDREEFILGISPDMEMQLMLDAEAASNDSWAQMVLKWFEKRLTGDQEAKLLGVFKVVTSNRLQEDSSTGIETAVCFAKRAFLSSPMAGMETHIDILPKDRHAVQVTGYAKWGCFRLFDEMVLEMPCDPSP
jgi:hypothetical protein